MTWTIDGPQGNESAKIKWELVEFTRGRGLDLGCGPFKTFPHFIGVDNGHHDAAFGWQNNADISVDTCENLDLFGSASMDFVFSSHLLEHIEHYDKALKDWWRVVKPGGYLILYLPDEDEYPKCGEPGANPDHKWNVNYDRVVDSMQEIGSWDLVRFEKRNQGIEYSLFFVFKKRHTAIKGKEHLHSWKKPRPDKTAAVCRYGAFGDLIMASSIFPGLKEQGYHVTLYTTPNGYEIAKADPHVDKFIIQDNDQVPNVELADFWASLRQKYDKFVNLSETVEGTLLSIPGRIAHTWPQEVRHKYLNVNYLEFHHNLAGVPLPPRQKFYPTAEERAWAEKERRAIGGDIVILWSLSGSSVHKTWPYLDSILARILLTYRQAKVVLVGDTLCQMLESGWEAEERVIRRSGIWSIRKSLSFVEQSDLVIGPETGLLNAAGMLPMPKIITLSHSSEENLTKHWINTVALTQPTNSDVPCAKSACHMMHYGFEHCYRDDETGQSKCQANISPDQMWNAITHSLGKKWQLPAA